MTDEGQSVLCIYTHCPREHGNQRTQACVGLDIPKDTGLSQTGSPTAVR